MFSLIFYCGLLSSVVSAHFNNNTAHDEDELDINTRLSTLASTTIPLSKDCILKMKEDEISQIVELFNSNLVNVVVIYISFPNGSHWDFYVSLSSSVGREVLYALQRWEFRFFQWTLKAGIRNFKLNVKGSQSDCIKTAKKAIDFELKTTQHIVDNINLATNYHVCTLFKDTSFGIVTLTCCQITKPNLATKFNYKCPKGNSFLFGSNLPWNVIFIIVYLFSSFYFMWLPLVLVSRSEFDLKYPEYYKLDESMSASSILLKVFWDGNGRVVSFIRGIVLLGAISYFCFFMLQEKEKSTLLFCVIIFGMWISCLLSFSTFLKSRNTNSSLILNKIKERRNNVVQRYVRFYHNPDPLWEKGKRGDFEIVVKIILSPFNPNVWRNLVSMLYNKCIIFARCVTERFNNRILKTLALCTYLVFAVLTCFVYACLFLCVLIVLATTYPIVTLWNFFALVLRLEHRQGGFCNRFVFLLFPWGLFLLLSLCVLIVTAVIMSFLLGMFLNLIYFIPYFALFSVLTFYCCTYWKTMEEKYFVLKQLIYEACRETRNNNGCIPNRHPKSNEEVLLVVSKKLYDKIREKLLPYDTNLFYCGLKMVWSIAFSLSIFALINLLNEFNVTGLVQVLTTASVSVMPYVFNMVALKTSEAKTKALNDQLKMKVKLMVEDLTRKHPELARTVLIMEDDDDTTANNLSIVEENIQYESSV